MALEEECSSILCVYSTLMMILGFGDDMMRCGFVKEHLSI
jgi:hypothetical protein